MKGRPNIHSKIQFENKTHDIEMAVGIWLGVRKDSGGIFAGTEERVVRANSYRRKAGAENHGLKSRRRMTGLIQETKVDPDSANIEDNMKTNQTKQKKQTVIKC